MMYSPDQPINFSFFMFTADLRPDDEAYSHILVSHARALREIGYAGFDVHIATPAGVRDHAREVDSYTAFRRRFDAAGLGDVPLTTNVGTTQRFDITSPYAEQRRQGLAYLKSRVDITAVLAGDAAVMSGPFLYPYGVFPTTDDGEPIWSDALREWMRERYRTAEVPFAELAEYADRRGVTLAIEPVKNWETPGPSQLADVLDFLDCFASEPAGVAADTAQIVLESSGPDIFLDNLTRAAAQNRLHSVHISAPDRGEIRDSWIPWDVMVPALQTVFHGQYLIEVFNAVPPFVSSMRMSRRRFWRPGEDVATSAPCAYNVAAEALSTLRHHLAVEPAAAVTAQTA